MWVDTEQGVTITEQSLYQTVASVPDCCSVFHFTSVFAERLYRLFGFLLNGHSSTQLKIKLLSTLSTSTTAFVWSITMNAFSFMTVLNNYVILVFSFCRCDQIKGRAFYLFFTSDHQDACYLGKKDICGNGRHCCNVLCVQVKFHPISTFIPGNATSSQQQGLWVNSWPFGITLLPGRDGILSP